MEKQRTVYLDLVRVVACMMVIVMHAPFSGTAAASRGAFLTVLSYITAPCVPLFFMVSGALLLPAKPSVDAMSYLKKRVGKVVGPTFFFSLFYIALNYPKYGLSSLLSIPFCAQGSGVLWFMYTLIGLYLLVPILSPWLRQASQRELSFYLLLWLISLCYPFLSQIVSINSSSTGILYYFTGYAGYFLLGYYLNRYPVSSLFWFLPILVLPLPFLNKYWGWQLDFYEAFWYLSAPVAVLSTAGFLFLKNISEKIVVGRFLLHASSLSFGIYLIHIFIMRHLLWQWEPISSMQNYYLQTAIVAVLTFVLSYYVCRMIAYLPFSSYLIGYTSKK